MIWLELPGLILLLIGIFCANVGAIGLIRFPDVFIRSHAATVSVMGGSVVSLFGLVLIGCQLGGAFPVKVFIIALIVIFASPTGTHAILKAAHKSRVQMWHKTFCDMLREEEG
ncbi:MAG: monovalent cation/H(+) antiporter subunit G [Candidatus Hecatellaceae archaeon]|nr:MAG: cation:proton antiporter [Candidatus Hecatellales archaeon]